MVEGWGVDRSSDPGYFVAATPRQPTPPDPQPPPRGPRRRRLRIPSWVVVGVVVGVLVGALPDGDAPGGELSIPPAVAVQTGEGRGTYAFRFVDDAGEPVRWDPCSPIRYVVNLQGAPYDSSLEDIQRAFAEVTEASGIRFEFVGKTDEVASEDRPAHLDGYGAGWAPVLVAWTHPGDAPSLDGTVAATGGAVPIGNPPIYVSGSIHLDRTSDLRPGFGRGRAWGTVLLHEAGHLLGLGHVDAESEVMHPGGERSQPAAAVRWGVGDREGLRRLGLEAGCQDVPSAPVP